MDRARRAAHSLLSSGRGSEKARGIVALLKAVNNGRRIQLLIELDRSSVRNGRGI